LVDGHLVWTERKPSRVQAIAAALVAARRHESGHEPV
jgi:hypothetical protein